MNISLDDNDLYSISLALTYYNESETVLRNKSQIKFDKDLAKKINTKFKKRITSFSSEEMHLILTSVTFSYASLVEMQEILSGDIPALVENQKLLKKIEPVYEKFIPHLDSLFGSEN